MKSQDIVPVLVSIVVIILVAVFEKQSKLVAAITATMPIGATLALWIVYASNRGDSGVMKEFSLGLLVGIVPTLGFLIAAWLAARAGYKLGGLLATGYVVWGIGVATVLFFRRFVGG